MKSVKTQDSPVILNWVGPIGYRNNEIVPHKIDPAAPNRDHIEKVSQENGVYCIVGDHLIYGPRSLLYIGRTKTTFAKRLYEHRDWLNEEWRVEIYFAEVKPTDLWEPVEKLLIYSHSPSYNSQNIDALNLEEPLTIWNTGRYWGLLPEISSVHPWYKQAKKRIKTTQDR